MAEITRDTTNNTIGTGTGGLELSPSGTDVVTINNGVVLPDGTKTAPAIRLADDTNTGIYSPTNDTIALTGHGEDALRVTGVASSVNYVEIKPSTTGNAVSIESAGSDTDIDVNVVAKGAGTLKVDGTAVSLSGHSHALNDLTDVDLTGSPAPATGDVLMYNGTTWVHDQVAGGVTTFEALTDTAVGSPIKGDVLYYSGTAWANLAKGTASQVLTMSGSPLMPTWAAAAGGGEDYFACNSTGTLPSATGTDSIAIGPTAAASGVRAIAIETGDTAGTGVTGTNSISIGAYNRSEATNTIAIGNSVQCRVAGGVGVGRTLYVWGTDAVAVGYNLQNGSYGDYSTSIGQSLEPLGWSVRLGYNHGGVNSSDNNIISLGHSHYSHFSGEVSWSLGSFASATGKAKCGLFPMRCETTTATVTELGLNNTLASYVSTPTGRILLPNNSTWLFDVDIVARRTDADGENAAYNLKFAIKRDANAASTALVGSVTKTVIAEDTAAWDVDASADTTTGYAKLTVTGEASKTIRWVASVRMTMVGE